MRGRSIFSLFALVCALTFAPGLMQKAQAYKWIGISQPDPPRQVSVPAPAKKQPAGNLKTAAPENTAPEKDEGKNRPRFADLHNNPAPPVAAIEDIKKNMPIPTDGDTVTVQVPKAYVNDDGSLKSCGDSKKVSRWLNEQSSSKRKKILAQTVPVNVPVKSSKTQ